MKPSTCRRVRRRNAGREIGASKLNSRQQIFFGDPALGGFFQPHAAIQRKCEKCEEEDKQVKRMPDKKEEDKPIQRMEADGKQEEEKTIQKKSNTDVSSAAAKTSASKINSMDNGGSTMSTSLQAFFGNRMHYNFADVKIHTGQQSDQSAKAINAQAYTFGNHIVFANGKYDPKSEQGKKLLAHELTHVMQQNQAAVPGTVQRKTVDENAIEEPELLPALNVQVTGSQIQNTTHYADCANVSVSGSTDANYRSSGTLNGRPTRSTDCSGCTGNNCITVSGSVISRFNTAPVVHLPPVPGGLNRCEQQAVRSFINGTLNSHEQQHVAAFNTYRGTVTTPFTFTGCRADLQAEVQAVHDAIEAPRRAASDALSAALDANGANIFTVTCDCPDPEPSK